MSQLLPPDSVFPAPAGLRLLDAWRIGGKWGFEPSLPVLGITFDENLIPSYITPADVRPLEYSKLDSEVEWATALLEVDGSVISPSGAVFANADGWLAALRLRTGDKPAQHTRPRLVARKAAR